MLKISQAVFHSLETPELLPVDLQYVCHFVCECVFMYVCDEGGEKFVVGVCGDGCVVF